MSANIKSDEIEADLDAHVNQYEQDQIRVISADAIAIVRSLGLLTRAVLCAARELHDISGDADKAAGCLDYISDHMPGDR